MNYISTKGQAPRLSFSDVVVTGLASDGGLYVPETLPFFSREEIASWHGLSYQELAFIIFKPFIGDEIADQDLKLIIEKAYSNFDHAAIAPLIQTGHNEWVLELFHGPTLAFKDFALQFLGHLLDFVLAQRGQKVAVMAATSGDTGSAAIEGCRDCQNIDIFVLHPHQRVSEVQRRQMTTVLDDSVFNIAVEGNFDDCQNMVKASFGDQSFLPENRQLVAVNSINWARIMAQTVYYFYASLALGGPHRAVSFSVPTGNFGDIYAGSLAQRMGLPIEQLVVATNSNDILHRCIQGNDHSKQPSVQSLSPSMDIMVSSNFERLLFDLCDHDGGRVRKMMAEFDSGKMTLDEQQLTRLGQIFSSSRVSDQQTLKTISSVYQGSDYVVDPHTAVGITAARECRRNSQTPMICLATAHPAKFAEAVTQSIDGYVPDLPAHLSGLLEREERYKILPNELAEVQRYISSKLRA